MPEKARHQARKGKGDAEGGFLPLRYSSPASKPGFPAHVDEN